MDARVDEQRDNQNNIDVLRDKAKKLVEEQKAT